MASARRALRRNGAVVRVKTLEDGVAAVNALAGVSHNYLRQHRFNMWFTLQETSPTQVQATLGELGSKFGIEFHSLPVTRIFKLDVRFEAVDPEQTRTLRNRLARIRRHDLQVLSPPQREERVAGAEARMLPSESRSDTETLFDPCYRHIETRRRNDQMVDPRHEVGVAQLNHACDT